MTFVSKFLWKQDFLSLLYAQECSCWLCWCKSIVSFKRKCQTIFKVALPSYIFTSDLTSPHPPLDLLLSQFFILVILIGVIISYCSLNLHFSNGLWCTPFHVLICHPYLLFCAVSVHVFWPFLSWIVFLMLSFESSLYILDMSPCLDMWLWILSSGL